MKELVIKALGEQNYTKVIQEAIDVCHKDGGGVIMIEKGVYTIGMLTLRDGITLHLEKGAVLEGEINLDAYPRCEYMFNAGSSEPEDKGYALIYAYKGQNINIEGEGIIRGNGDWFSGKVKRPFLIRFIECADMSISGVRLENAGAWCTHIQRSKNIRVIDIHLISGDVVNADGIDIDSSEDILIENSTIDCHDDAICMKATSALPTRNVQIRGCDIRSHCSGVKIGTETIGDFEHILVENCSIRDCGVVAIKITPVDGAYVKDVMFREIEIVNSTGPIFVAIGKRQKTFLDAPVHKISHIENLHFEAMKITTKRYERISRNRRLNDMGQGIVLAGTNESLIENVMFKDIEVTFYGGVQSEGRPLAKIEDIDDAYPECHQLGILPAYGWNFKYTKGVKMEQCISNRNYDDIRPLISNYPE